MRLSIIIPSNDQAAAIGVTIDSVLCQDYKDVECWVIDCGGTGQTPEILRSYADKIRRAAADGLCTSKAMNQGLSMAAGNIVGWIDPGESYPVGIFQKMMQVFDEHPDISAVCIPADATAEAASGEPSAGKRSCHEFAAQCSQNAPTVFYRKEAVMAAGMLNEELQYAADYDLWLRIAKTHKTFVLHEKPVEHTVKTSFGCAKASQETLGVIQNHIGSPYLPPIRIGFDSSMTCVSKAGCGFYADSLANALCQVDHTNQYLFYPMYYNRCNPNFQNCTALAKTPNAHNLFFDGTTPEMANAAFRNTDMDITEMLGNPQVIHATGFSFIHHHKAANVYTVFDSSMVDVPDCTTEENRCFCFDMMHEASLYADMFISISQYSKDRFLHYFPYVEPERVRVIPLATRDTLKPNHDIDCIKGLGITVPDSYWLCVNTIEPRKNIVRLLHAYQQLNKLGDTRPLYLVGGKGWKDAQIYQQVKELSLSDHVFFTGYVSDEQLSALYTNCFAFLYPSLYEGFGLPVLEAMTMGAPVICSNSTSIPEVAGDAALYVDPKDTASIVNTMLTLQEHPQRRDSMIQQGLARAKQFSWQTNAMETIRCYYEAIWRHGCKSAQTR